MMKKYFYIFATMFKMSWMRSMEYRIDYLIWFTIDLCWSVADLVFLMTLLNSVQALGSWSQAEAIVAVGLFRLLGVFVWGWMWASFKPLPMLVNNGRLDMLLTKPIDSQFMVSVYDFNTDLLASIFSGTVMVWYGLSLAAFTVSLPMLLATVWLFLLAIILAYGIYFLIMTSVLFTERLNNAPHLFNALIEISKYPRHIFGWLAQRIFLVGIPMALMINVPIEALFGKTDHVAVILLHISAIGFFLLSRGVWQFGLKKYSSASS